MNRTRNQITYAQAAI